MSLMKFFTSEYVSAIPFVFSLINIIIAIWKCRKSEYSVDSKYIYHMIFTFIAGVILFFIARINSSFVIWFWVLMTAIVPLVEFLEFFDKREKSEFELSSNNMGKNSIIWGVLIVLPIFLIKTHHDVKQMKYAPDTIQTFNIEEINNSLDRIQEKYKEINKAVSQESSEMTATIEDILKQINEKNLELKDMNAVMSKMKMQIEYYEGLINLSDKEVQAVVYALTKDKYKDYLIGGVIGFFVSMLANHVSRRIRERKNRYHINIK